MQEEFLYHIWQFNLYNQNNLTTTQGESLFVTSPGKRNTVSGPDFDFSRIKLGEVEWAGQVEIHVKSSDWFRHNHHHDLSYSNIILHVVYEHDLEDSPGGHPILDLKGRIPKTVLERYQDLVELKPSIPCKAYHSELDEFTVSTWLECMLIERLEAKIKELEPDLVQTNHNWDEVAYRLLFRAFGMKHNKAGFEQLSRLVPYGILLKHANNPTQLLALLLGSGSLMEKFSDGEELMKEFDFLKHKYQLNSSMPIVWKYGGIRPSSHPHKRIIQFVDAFSPERIFSVWKDWLTNSNSLNIVSNGDEATYAKSFREHVAINAMLPLLFAYYRNLNDHANQDLVVDSFKLLVAEKNSVIRKWKELPLSKMSAFDTQALIQLTNYYCNQKKCLQCGIGNSILRNGNRR